VRRINWLFGVMLLLLGASAFSASAKLTWDDKEFMSTREIVPGMRGYGKTVFQGTKIEKFNIEVIGVLRKLDFGFDMILIKVLDGPVVDRRLQTVAGMSGSPIYIDNRLIGAYAYGWNFQQEQIAGVTPISAMLDSTEPGSGDIKTTGRMIADAGGIKIGDRIFTGAQVASNAAEAMQLKGTLTDNTMIMTPVSTPLFVSGMNERTLKPLQKILDKYNMIAAQGPGAGGRTDMDAPKLEAGSAVGVSLMSGDVSLAAVGTVTYVKDDTVLCFGHPFMGRGDIDMPLSVCYIDGIVNSAQSSFKLGSPIGKPVGAATSDRRFALAGKIGQLSKTIPATIFLSDAQRNLQKRYAAEVISDPEFAPILLYMYFMVSGSADLGDILGSGKGTYTGKLRISTDKYGDFETSSVFSPELNGWNYPLFDLYRLSSFLMQNKFEEVGIKSVFVDMSYVPGRNYATIEKVIPDRLVARPGDDVNFTVKIRPYGKPLEERVVKIHIPENTVDKAMGVIIAGGNEAADLKRLLKASPDEEEGVKGVIRYLQGEPTSNNLLVLKASPSPSYDYRGQKLTNIPPQIAQLLSFEDLSGGASNNGSEGMGMGRSSAMPSATMDVTPMPYILSGGEVLIITIQTKEADFSRGMSMMDMMNGPSPFLSTSARSGGGSGSDYGPGGPGGPGGSSEYEGDMAIFGNGMTTMQREQLHILQEFLNKDTQPRHTLNLPTLTPTMKDSQLLPLSSGMVAKQFGADSGDGGSGNSPSSGNPNGNPNGPGSGKPNRPGGPNDNMGRPGGPNTSTDPITMTAKENAWGLRNRSDFMTGKHIGTGVNSKGELTLVPAMRNIYTATDTKIITNRLVATANGTYIAGWGSNKVTCIKDDGTTEVLFPKTVADGAGIISITALTADAAGNLIVASWPDHTVRSIAADGAIKSSWRMPGDAVWNMAVTSGGDIYAVAYEGMILKLRADGGVQVGATVPDKTIYALAAGPDNTLYLATSPRGKVYRLNTLGYLEAVCEGEGPVASLLVGTDGTIFIGSAASNNVTRVMTNGTRKVIMNGIGSENSVTDLKMLNGVIFASTAPGGGIYRIEKPLEVEPVVTPIYARQDLRDGTDENAPVGPESIMVNALTVSPNNQLIAVTSAPVQVLKMTPRTSGTFISHILTAPSVSKWGQVEIRSTVKDNQKITIESRGGLTAIPDDTWSNWAPIGANGDTLTNAPAPNSQLRVTLTGTETTAPTMDFVKVHYLPINLVPVVKINVPVNSIWHGKHMVRWMGHDPEGDKVVYTVFSSIDDGKTWVPVEVKMAKPEPKKKPVLGPDGKPLVASTSKPVTDVKPVAGKTDPVTAPNPAKGDSDVTASPDDDGAPDSDGPDVDSSDSSGSDTSDSGSHYGGPDGGGPGMSGGMDESNSKTETYQTSFMWDTKKATDGVYLLKIVASDKYAKPMDAKTAESISTPFIVDNTPPTIDVADNVAKWADVSRLHVKDNLTTIVGGRYRLDDGPWVALVAEDGIFNTKDEWVSLISPDGPVVLTDGAHKLTIQVKDQGANVLTKNVTIGGKPGTKPTPAPTVPKNGTPPPATTGTTTPPPTVTPPVAVVTPEHKTWQGSDSAELAEVLFFSLNN